MIIVSRVQEGEREGQRVGNLPVTGHQGWQQATCMTPGGHHTRQNSPSVSETLMTRGPWKGCGALGLCRNPSLIRGTRLPPDSWVTVLGAVAQTLRERNSLRCAIFHPEPCLTLHSTDGDREAAEASQHLCRESAPHFPRQLPRVHISILGHFSREGPQRSSKLVL